MQEEFEPLSVRQLLDRLKEAEGCGTDGELAQWLGVSVRTLEQWVRRNSIPLQKVLLPAAQRNGLSLEWLLQGRGPQRVAALETVPEEDALESSYRIAGELYRALQGRGITADPEAFEEVVRVLHHNQLAGRVVHRDLVEGFAGAIQRAPDAAPHPPPIHVVPDHHEHYPVTSMADRDEPLRVYAVDRLARPDDWAVVRRPGAEDRPQVLPLSAIEAEDELLGVVLKDNGQRD